MRVPQPPARTAAPANMTPPTPNSQAVASCSDSANWVDSLAVPEPPTTHHAVPARKPRDPKHERSLFATSAPITIGSSLTLNSSSAGKASPTPAPSARGSIPPRPSPTPPLPPSPSLSPNAPSYVAPPNEFLPGMPGLPGWEPGPARVHHHADTLTDYCKKKTSGWQPMQEKRVRTSAWELDRWMRWAPGPREEYGADWVEEERRGFERLGKGDVLGAEEEGERKEDERKEGGIKIAGLRGMETPRSDSMFNR